MKEIKTGRMDSWAIQFAQFVNRWGTMRISVLFVFLTLMFTLVGSHILHYQFSGKVEVADYLTATLLALLSAPWVIFFFGELIKKLQVSRVELTKIAKELEILKEEEERRNHELEVNIQQLNHEITQRQKAQSEREQVLRKLENEIREKTDKEKQATRLSTLLRSIIDGSPDMIYYRNEMGQFTGCNKVAEQMTGKSEAELMGLTAYEVHDEELASQVVASDQEVLDTNTSITEELWLRFADGSRRYYQMRKVPFFDKQGNRLGLLAFGRDMTDRKRAEDGLTKASNDKTAFIATISHELRTPLNGIVGLSRMLRDTKLTQEQFSWVSTIYASAITLGNIFNDVIDLDKLDRDRLELALKTVSLKEFTQELGSILQLLASDKGLVLNTKILTDLPEYVEVDGTRLRQILWNLLFNAVKFTPKGSVNLTVEAMMAENNRCIVRFKVSDTGIGIPAAELSNIFAMYYQVDNEEHYSATGTGIGLAICKQLVTLMNGEIYVDSEVGKGTCFTVELPLEISTEPMQVEELRVTGLKILLVEDIQLNVTVAKALLEKLGQQVDVAMTGKDALKKARNTTYDLILLDIQLPDMNGFEVARQLHDESLVEGTAIVALTANVIKKRQDYLDNGMDEIISKPVKKSRMIEVFNRLFADSPPEFGPNDHGHVQTHLNTILDLELLTMLVETIGVELVHNSAKVLQQQMPNYLDSLQISLSAEDKSAVCSDAHKIKGAAGSVGLARVSRIADEIQQGTHPAWWQNVHNWVEELQLAYQRDMDLLEDWINQHIVED